MAAAWLAYWAAVVFVQAASLTGEIMSGGVFDYAFSRVDQFAAELALRLDEFDKVDEYGNTPNKFAPETLTKLREIEMQARHTAKLMREAEWLYSGDTGEDSFMRRVAEIGTSNAM